jgi:exopolysaccharide biosynthesis protein
MKQVNRSLRIGLLGAMIVLLAFLAPAPGLAREQGIIPIPLDAKEIPQPWEEGYLSGLEYEDPSLRVTIQTDRYLDTDIWIARVQIADPSQLRTAMAGRYGSQTIAYVSTMAKRVNAVLAINGDYFGYHNTGAVVRQGHTYRRRIDEAAKSDILLIDTEGNFHTLLNADAETFDDIYETLGGAWDEGGRIVNAFTFGPAFVVDGKPAHETFLRPDDDGDGLAQRMVLAQDGPLSYVCICSEGPESDNSKGLTLTEIAEYVLTLNCRTAYNLDGGGSASMVFNQEKINSLSTRKTRSVSDCIYFASAAARE